MNWYFEAWKKYAVFGGRAGRQEFWFFALFHILAYILLSIVAGVIGGEIGANLLSIYAFAAFLPGLAASVRRLHDINRSGWWLLIVAIPGIGPVVLLTFFLQNSQPAENQYGAIPNAATA